MQALIAQTQSSPGQRFSYVREVKEVEERGFDGVLVIAVAIAHYIVFMIDRST